MKPTESDLEKASNTKEVLENLNKVDKSEEFNKIQKSEDHLEDLKK